MVSVLIVVPVVNVFYQALSHGVGTYWHNLVGDPDTRHAIFLTLIVVPISVLLNVIFGIAAAWAVTRFRFPGRPLVTAIDLPFAISPVVAGLMFVLLFGLQGYFGPWLRGHGIRIIFALPGLILATTFVTLPFVARELIPVMEAIGPDEEMAALSLGRRLVANLSADHAAQYQVGAALRSHPLQLRGRWASSARCTSFPGISPARPTRCRCESRAVLRVQQSRFVRRRVGADFPRSCYAVCKSRARAKDSSRAGRRACG